MAAGWQVGDKCQPSADLAGREVCASIHGVTNAGLLSCSGYSIQGDEVVLTLQLAQTQSTAEVVLQPCERMTYADTWFPLFAMLVVGTLLILGARELIDMFRTENNNV